MLHFFRPKIAQVRAAIRYAMPPRWKEKVVGSCPVLKETYLVATTQGLFSLRDGQIVRHLRGRFYGIAPAVGLVFERCGEKGRILRINSTAQVVRRGLSGGVHQMDSRNGRVFIADTYNNAIIETDPECKSWAVHFPLGRLKQGRSSDNYGHMNSVFALNTHAWILCHNETVKTGKASEALQVDANFAVTNRVSLPAGSAHNYVIYDGKPLFCDSLGGRVVHGDRTLFETRYFTRGISITEDGILVGGSERADRQARLQSGGAIFVLADPSGELKATILMPGQVQEIRRLDGPDHGSCSIADFPNVSETTGAPTDRPTRAEHKS